MMIPVHYTLPDQELLERIRLRSQEAEYGIWIAKAWKQAYLSGIILAILLHPSIGNFYIQAVVKPELCPTIYWAFEEPLWG